jgi:hypothetical protein
VLEITSDKNYPPSPPAPPSGVRSLAGARAAPANKANAEKKAGPPAADATRCPAAAGYELDGGLLDNETKLELKASTGSSGGGPPPAGAPAVGAGCPPGQAPDLSPRPYGCASRGRACH